MYCNSNYLFGFEFILSLRFWYVIPPAFFIRKLMLTSKYFCCRVTLNIWLNGKAGVSSKLLVHIGCTNTECHFNVIVITGTAPGSLKKTFSMAGCWKRLKGNWFLYCWIELLIARELKTSLQVIGGWFILKYHSPSLNFELCDDSVHGVRNLFATVRSSHVRTTLDQFTLMLSKLGEKEKQPITNVAPRRNLSSSQLAADHHTAIGD